MSTVSNSGAGTSCMAMLRDCFERARPSSTGLAISSSEHAAIAKPRFAERERAPWRRSLRRRSRSRKENGNARLETIESKSPVAFGIRTQRKQSLNEDDIKTPMRATAKGSLQVIPGISIDSSCSFSFRRESSCRAEFGNE